MTAGNNLEHWSDPDVAARAWLVRLQSGEATQGDLASFATWRAENPENTQSFERAVLLWDRLGPALARGCPDMAAMRTPAVSRRGFLGGGAGIAAMIATAIVIGNVSTPAGATRFETSKGERKQFRLGEDASVELNAASRIYYWPEALGSRVELDRGEALVAAACGEGRRLVAFAEGATITARNARFLLHNRDGIVRVSCLEGEMEVRSGGEARTLTEYHKLEIRDARIQPTIAPVARDAETVWRKNLLIFRNQRAGEVVSELNRYLPEEMVVLTGKEDVRISGVIHLDRADLAVDHIARSLDMKVTRLPGGIALLRRR